MQPLQIGLSKIRIIVFSLLMVLLICVVSCINGRWPALLDKAGGIESQHIVGLKVIVDWPTAKLEFTPMVSHLYLDVRAVGEGSELRFMGCYRRNECIQQTEFDLPSLGIDSPAKAAELRCFWIEPDGTKIEIPVGTATISDAPGRI